MSETQIQPGGNHVPDGTRVCVDNVTVFGDGSSESPLNSPGGGGGAVHTDGTTITGNGTLGSPLSVDPAALAGDVPVSHNGTLTGNGTSGSPLGVVADSVAVSVDGTTIAGTGVTGSSLHVIPGGLSGSVAVATDSTITGDGTTGSPLHAVSSGGGVSAFLAEFNGVGLPKLGQPVEIVSGAPSFGICSVTPAANNGSRNAAVCVGVIVASQGGDPVGSVRVQAYDMVTLTTAQWDAVAGTTGGLTGGTPYYLGIGNLTATPPVTPGLWTSQVVIGVNATTGLLATPDQPEAVTFSAAALVRSNAFVTSSGFGVFGRTGAGRYQLPLTGTPPADDNCIVTVTLSTNFAVAVSVAAAVVAGVVDVFISTEPGGAGIDGDFYVSVIGIP